MGKRKRISAEKRKEIKKATTIASLRNSTMSPRKMRLVADLVRGKKVEEALNILSFSTKHAARSLKKLLLSAISNWEQKKYRFSKHNIRLVHQNYLCWTGKNIKKNPASSTR